MRLEKIGGIAFPIKLYGVPRGGITAAVFVAWALGLRATVVDQPDAADVIIDDLIDSGATAARYHKVFPTKHFDALFKKKPGEWLVFPWEGATKSSADDIPTRLLQFVGEDPGREGLRGTPARFLAAWADYTRGYDQDVKELFTVFADGAENYDELVLVRDIPVYSKCEHHLESFFGKAHVGYLPDKKIVGLSKLVRLVNVFARRLQVQERLTSQVAHALQEHLLPQGVGVVMECRHLCMESRGVCTPGTTTTTSCLLGALKDRPETRAEFMGLVR